MNILCSLLILLSLLVVVEVVKPVEVPTTVNRKNKESALGEAIMIG
jgi:hypothetical protein